MISKFPWEFHPDLTEERLIETAKILVKAYEEVRTFYLEDKGDTRWSQGCRRYMWACRGLKDAANSGAAPFLSILTDSGTAFLFRIGKVPVKFKCTDPDDPNQSILRQSETEIRQLSLLEMPGVEDPGALPWRFVIEDDIDGEVLRVVFLAIDDSKRTHCFWQLPMAKVAAAPITVVNDIKDEGVDLESAEVEIIGVTEKEKQDA